MNLIVKKMRNRIVAILILYLAISQVAFVTVYGQQERIDSLEQALESNRSREQVMIYYELARQYYSSGQRDKAQEIIEEGKDLAENIGYDLGMLKLLTYEGLMYQSMGNVSLSVEILNQAIELGKKERGMRELLVEAMNHQTVNYFRLQNIDSMYNNARKALALAEEIEDMDLRNYLAEIHNHLGLASYFKGELFQSLSEWKKELEIRKDLDDLGKLAQAYSNVGVIYKTQGDYSSALEYYQENLKIVESIGNEFLIARANSNIGNIYYSIGMDYQKALEYYNKSVEGFLALDDSVNASSAYLNISTVYLAEFVDLSRSDKSMQRAETREKFDQTLSHSFKAIDYAIGRHSKAMANRNLGSVYIASGDYEKAKDYLDDALAYFEGQNDVREVATTLGYLGECYHRMGDFSRSIEIYSKAMDYHQEIGHRRELYDVYKNMSDVFLAMNDCNSALDFFKRYAELKDSTLSERYLETLRGYEHMQREREIALLNEKSARQQAENRRQRVLLISMVLIFFLVFVFSLVIVKQYNEKKKANIRLEEQNVLLEERNNEIQSQRDQIFHQNQEITDSITYASRIQRAILPPEGSMKSSIPDHFIFFRPRDIVSGDFYWIYEKDQYIAWIAADCTGHGVPGAFMSMLGTAFLNEIVSTKQVLDTAVILDELKANIIKSLHQTGEVGTSQDGMDVALCLLNKETKELQFSGAYNPLIMIRDGELIEYKADKMPIGVSRDKIDGFTKEVIQLKKGDCLYVFSDGYVDQFGGPEGRKFMKKRFKEMLVEMSDLPMEKQGQRLDKALAEWTGTEYEQIDDIIVIGVRV